MLWAEPGFGLDGFLHITDGLPSCPRHPHGCGELGLPARAAQMQDDVARDGLGDPRG
ncbi:hypothetical protein MSAR_23730 [Mycolicibacterium sarraceniae]|uniref:Uncharacterized protein n=1 Tax=Mycolicibacterium sarraceniae TaxID=1534348 RepID=A0A7I7SQG4_9MYCO|nr:hypothetical protein MSAR_23730 [Mycolicibacterium sarraceniae]